MGDGTMPLGGRTQGVTLSLKSKHTCGSLAILLCHISSFVSFLPLLGSHPLLPVTVFFL